MRDFRREKELLQWIRYGGWDAGNRQMEQRIQCLFEEGVDINFIEGKTDCEHDESLPDYMRCYDGGESKQTLLMHAIENSSYHIATVLIENGANLELTNQKGQTALSLACSMGYKHFVQLLLDNGAYLDTIDNEGNTPLLIAVNRGHLAISTMLLESGSNSNIINKKGHSALIDACINRYPAMVSLLLNFDAYINQTIGRMLYTPLMIACKCHCYEIIVQLLKHGADKNFLNSNGQSALNILLANHKTGHGLRETTFVKDPALQFESILKQFEDLNGH